MGKIHIEFSPQGFFNMWIYIVYGMDWAQLLHVVVTQVSKLY